MAIKVKTKEKEINKDVELREDIMPVEMKNGELVEQTKEETKVQIAKETGIETNGTGASFHDMSVQQLDKQLVKFIDAVDVIKCHMVADMHFLEISGVDKPIITKQGIAWIATATNMKVTTELDKEIIDFDNDFIYYRYKAKATWGGFRMVEALGSANSKEFNQASKYKGEKAKKSVFDVDNDVMQMAIKRAKSQAVREMIAMTDAFEFDTKNPKANNRSQMGVYTLFYKYFMEYAPVAPKKQRQKNGKWKFFNEKEKLTWQKEYLKAKYFTPQLYKMGMQTFGSWGIKDVARLEEEIPKWTKQFMELNELNKEFLENQKYKKGVLND